MKIQIWGTRGSIPTPSTSEFQTSYYGGDTTCFLIEAAGQRVILDGGSGLRNLGLYLSTQPRPIQATFFFSHVHWDHIQGFPFFLPAFVPGNRFTLYGPSLVPAPGLIGCVLEKALRGQQEDLNFPIQLKDMPAEMRFYDLHEFQSVLLADHEGHRFEVHSAPLNHPGGCLGYRFVETRPNGTRAIFSVASDNEHLQELNPNVQQLAKDADLLVYDCQYTPEEYEGLNHNFSRQGWGHSTWEWGIKEAHAAGAKRLIMNHHDPLHDDTQIEKMESEAQKTALPLGLRVEAARQFNTYEI